MSRMQLKFLVNLYPEIWLAKPTCGKTPGVSDFGRLGMPSASALSTVVKQMLYSWMMDGYSELKSSSRMYLSYSPFLGSKTSPPRYEGPFFLLPAKRIARSSKATRKMHV
jgi:hypothetical protein